MPLMGRKDCGKEDPDGGVGGGGGAVNESSASRAACKETVFRFSSAWSCDTSACKRIASALCLSCICLIKRSVAVGMQSNQSKWQSRRKKGRNAKEKYETRMRTNDTVRETEETKDKGGRKVKRRASRRENAVNGLTNIFLECLGFLEQSISLCRDIIRDGFDLLHLRRMLTRRRDETRCKRRLNRSHTS